jgi:hypothetical protein
MIKLMEICELINASNSFKQKFTLREIYINPKHVVSLREETNYQQKLIEGELPRNLDDRQQFTRLVINRGQTGLEVVVIGSPDVVYEKIKGGKRVLKG